MNILSFISNIFKPAADIVDAIHTSDEEKGKLKNALVELQNTVMLKQMELQEKLVDMSSKVAIAETTSDNTFTKIYRPLLLCGMFLLICADSFGLTTQEVPEVFYSSFGTAFGVVGSLRTAEKIATNFKNKKG